MGELLKRLFLLLLMLALVAGVVFYGNSASKMNLDELWVVTAICLILAFAYLRQVLKPAARKYTREQIVQGQQKRRRSPILVFIGIVMGLAENLFDFSELIAPWLKNWWP